MQFLSNSLRYTAKYINLLRNLPHYFDEEERRLVFQSVVIGVVVWGIVYSLKQAVHFSFAHTVEWLDGFSSPLWVFVPLLTGSVLVAAITLYRATILYYRDQGGHVHELLDVEGDGLERAISLYYTSEPTFEQALLGREGVEVRWELPTFSLALRKFLATLITLGSGGSGGLEASVTLIGESVSSGLFKPRAQMSQVQSGRQYLRRVWRWWRPDNPDDLQTAQLSGIAAAVAVLLGAPFAAAFFATEVMYRKRPIIEKLVYSLISSLVAFFLTDVFTDGHTSIFKVETLIVPPSDWHYFGLLIVMGFTISVMSLLFAQMRRWFDHALHDQQPNIWWRHLLGAAITAVVAVLVYYIVNYLLPLDHDINAFELVLGTGDAVIDAALAGELTIALASLTLFAKMVATLATIGSGGSAGLLIPSVFFGTMVAAIFARIFPQYAPLMFVIPAMTASLVSIANVPLAAIMFTVELFGTSYMVPALVMLVVASVLAHDSTIYRTQREQHMGRQIMPGIGSRRIVVPAAWNGKTLVDIDFRKQFDLNVVGLMEQQDELGLPRVHLGTESKTVLEPGDVLVVIGPEEKLDALEQKLRRMRQQATETVGH